MCIQKDKYSARKIIQKKVIYLVFIDCTHDIDFKCFINHKLQKYIYSLDKGSTNSWTRKRALHARMSHSTVYNTTVSNKKTNRTLMK